MNDYKIQRPDSNDEDPLWWKALEVIWENANIYDGEKELEESLAPATKGQRAVYAVYFYSAEVDNGGHDQFFFNSTGLLWEEVLKGFDLLELPEFKKILEKALTHFPNSKPSKNREERIKQLDAIDFDLYEIDKEFYALDKGGVLREKFNQYILTHPEEFFK